MLRTMEELLNAAKGYGPMTMAIAVAQDKGVLEAACAAADQGLIRPILIGNRAEILRIAADAGLAVSTYEIIDVGDDKAVACTKAVELVKSGPASLLMKGFVDTSYVMKAVLNKENGLKKSNLISHVLLLEVPGFDRFFYVTDSAMNIAPTLEQKGDILKNAVVVAHALGNSLPKVAVLCAVEKTNPKMPCTLDAAALTEKNRSGEIGGCLVEGPLALDNAVSPEAAIHKGVDGSVAGKADILLVPDIEAGNLLNKSMEYFAHAKKAGVMMGAEVPVVLTSRATSAQSKMYSIALGVLIAGSAAKA